jgi:Flp pilus assembly protein protease CpaA
MIDWLLYVILVLLIVIALIDLKTMAIPSILLTALIFMVAFLNYDNFWFGAMGFIMAYLLYEAGFFSGIGDVKVMTAIAFLISTVNIFFFFVVITLVFGVAWKGLVVWRFKANEKAIPDEFPFLPVFLFVYLSLLFGGLI